MPEVPNSGGNDGDLVFIRHFDDGFIKMADKNKIAMVTTGIRHFRH